MTVTRRAFGLWLYPVLRLVRAASEPDFTGTWKLNLAKSKLEITPPESSVFYIDHQEPNFRLKRTHVFSKRERPIFTCGCGGRRDALMFDGKPNTWGIELIVGGPEVVQRTKR